MRRKNTEKISDILSMVLKQNNLDERLYETKVVNSWPEVLGENIMKYTTKIFFQNKKLFVELSSSVLRQELFLTRDEIIKSLNNHVGVEVVKEIIFM